MLPRRRVWDRVGRLALCQTELPPSTLRTPGPSHRQHPAPPRTRGSLTTSLSRRSASDVRDTHRGTTSGTGSSRASRRHPRPPSHPVTNRKLRQSKQAFAPTTIPTRGRQRAVLSGPPEFETTPRDPPGETYEPHALTG